MENVQTFNFYVRKTQDILIGVSYYVFQFFLNLILIIVAVN